MKRLFSLCNQMLYILIDDEIQTQTENSADPTSIISGFTNPTQDFFYPPSQSMAYKTTNTCRREKNKTRISLRERTRHLQDTCPTPQLIERRFDYFPPVLFFGRSGRTAQAAFTGRGRRLRPQSRPKGSRRGEAQWSI